jgi:hypothetical protein
MLMTPHDVILTVKRDPRRQNERLEGLGLTPR